MASVGALYIIVWSQLLSNTITQRIAVRLRLCLCGVVCGCGVDGLAHGAQCLGDFHFKLRCAEDVARVGPEE